MTTEKQNNNPLIFDNSETTKTVLSWLKSHIKSGDHLRFVSAYFSIYGYQALKDYLKDTKMQFLFGEPSNVGNVDPTPQAEKSFTLIDGKMQADNPLKQKWQATECQQWVERDDTEIRTIKEARLLHGKMYHLQHSNSTPPQALSGSSNFTKNGLGTGQNSNLELNLTASPAATADLATWFDDLWHSDTKSSDAKASVLEALQKLGADQTPQFIYYKTLYHLFEDKLRFIDESEGTLQQTPHGNTAIWRKLYEFQRRGAIGAINRLLQHNGCIIADSVGLGKTYTALAIIKYFELRNENVLVLCPKRLRENWTRYQAAAANQSNPFTDDRFQYHLLSHTDLGRDSGEVGGINLKNINWGNYSLVVIDESHNFRNAPSTKQTDDPTARKSRYRFLLEDVIKSGVPTKVLMLSATPVNNRLADLANQIMLFSGNNDQHFAHSLEISSLRQTLRNAQRRFTEWQELAKPERKKETLLNALDEQFYRILDAVTIARSRHHLTKFYPEFAVDGFPTKNKPAEKRPPTDSQGELQYADMAARIESLQLAIYYPSDYLSPDSDLYARMEQERRDSPLNQKNREQSLVYMMRTNLLKRLESSVDAYRESLTRVIDKIDKKLDLIAEYQNGHTDTSFSDSAPDESELEGNDEYSFGGKIQYHLKDFDRPRWQKALQQDHDALTAMRTIAERVKPPRDAKLAVLREAIKNKITHPTIDKNGKPNRKVLIFTTFTDTVNYLYKELQSLAQQHGCTIAEISGSTTTKYADTLDRFAPLGREYKLKPDQTEIDILIATDCISEGQNLQDCDLVINYDVHWNPVRIIQRFGRIDRIGSQNRSLSMINFWPDMQLEEHLNLQRRVLTRMELANIAATGQDNLLADEPTPDSTTPPTDDMKNTQLALDYRDQQMRRLNDEILQEGQQPDDLDLSDFTLDDFLAELRTFMENNKQLLERAPLGLFSITPPYEKGSTATQHPLGTIFCLRHRKPLSDDQNEIPPRHLVYVKSDGTPASLGKHALTVLRSLAQSRTDADQKLARWFDAKTHNGHDLTDENNALTQATAQIIKSNKSTEAKNASGGGRMAKRTARTKTADDYDLITWLIIAPHTP